MLSLIRQGWHGTLLAWAILALPLFCNIWARRILAPLEVLGGIVHVALFIVFVVVLVAMVRFHSCLAFILVWARLTHRRP